MLFFALFGLLATANAHSWIEQMTVIAPNGTFSGAPGYARGNVMRGPGFADADMVNLLTTSDGLTLPDTAQMCKDSQTTQTQTSGSPRLQAAAGAAIALRFQENGHVTFPDTPAGKPARSGKVFVYGTTQPKANEQFSTIHNVWTADGSGGDKRGALLSTQTFDDGQCYQVNSGPISAQRQQEFPHDLDQLMGKDLWCQQDLALPADAPSGTPYTLYWVWDWSTVPGTTGAPNGKAEIYTTCMDVDITSSNANTKVVGGSFVSNQDLNHAAISSEFAQLGNPTAAADASPTASATSPSFFSNSAQTTSTTFSTSAAPSGNGNGNAQGPSTFQTQFASASTSQVTPSSSFSVMPIPPKSTSQAVPVSTSYTMTTSSMSQAIAPSAATSAAAGLSRTQNGQPFQQTTVTEFDDVTQTVYQTVSPTGFGGQGSVRGSSGFERRTSTSTAVVTVTVTPVATVPSFSFQYFSTVYTYSASPSASPSQMAATNAVAPLTVIQSLPVPVQTSIAAATAATPTEYRLRGRKAFVILPSSDVPAAPTSSSYM